MAADAFPSARDGRPGSGALSNRTSWPRDSSRQTVGQRQILCQPGIIGGVATVVVASCPHGGRLAPSLCTNNREKRDESRGHGPRLEALARQDIRPSCLPWWAPTMPGICPFPRESAMNCAATILGGHHGKQDRHPLIRFLSAGSRPATSSRRPRRSGARGGPTCAPGCRWPP
jgi:hypothetical protein